MPYGPMFALKPSKKFPCFNPSYGLHALRAGNDFDLDPGRLGFNPSYGLHALRAISKLICLGQIGVSIPHMGCMPYGLRNRPQDSADNLFQSLIWVACPTGEALNKGNLPQLLVFQSLIWVACPTGSYCAMTAWRCACFNPSYGLHALRAALRHHDGALRRGFNPSYGLHALRAWPFPVYADYKGVSIPHMGCMPYGLREFIRTELQGVWVSIPHMGCMPYGRFPKLEGQPREGVSIPHMGCMPYGLDTQTPKAARGGRVSIPHMGCMPFGQTPRQCCCLGCVSFNPSYGLHALRACRGFGAVDRQPVSIPHMGCMPYGLRTTQLLGIQLRVSIPHMGCMPYGLTPV